MQTLSGYRSAKGWTQAELARALGVSQAYISQLERGGRPITRKLATRLSRLPDMPAAVVPPSHAELDAVDADFASDLAALGYSLLTPASAAERPLLLLASDRPSPPPHSADRPSPPPHSAERPSSPPHSAERPAPPVASHPSRPGGLASATSPSRTALRNPAAVIVAVLSRPQVAPSVMAALPWVLVTYASLDRRWLVDQARRRNLQNRLGFLTDLALDLLRARARAASTQDYWGAIRTTATTTTDEGGATRSATTTDDGEASRSAAAADDGDATRSAAADDPGTIRRATSPDDRDRTRSEIDERLGLLEALREDLEVSRLANADTLARVLTSTERQFFEEHRSAAARHWNLLTGLTIAQLPYK